MIDPTLHTAICAAFETSIATALRYDPASKNALARLQGQVLAVELTKPTLIFYLVPTTDGVRVQSIYDGTVTTRLKGSPLALASLVQSSQVNLADSGIEVFGNTGLLIELQKILQNLDIDWEEAMSQVLGDVAGPEGAKVLRGAYAWLSERKRSLTRLSGEYLTEELRAIPTRTELNNFNRDVDELRLAVDRASANVAACKNAFSTANNHSDQLK